MREEMLELWLIVLVGFVLYIGALAIIGIIQNLRQTED
jgi:hypothetical protein